MADIIQLLPDSVANQIAAGEVIQRPASAIKELLENAVDAKSSHVKLIIKDAGKTLMQVIDDGTGMSETDARMCFERHATSKIRKAEDLYGITSMGFRGEAMASIAAISQCELKSRIENEELGTKILVEGSILKEQVEDNCAKGTSLSVKNLFFNVPARRKFLKSDPVETRHIVDEFQRISLANPQVAFSMHHNNNEVFNLHQGNFKQRIVGIFGKSYEQKLVPIEEETNIVNLSGFIGKPEAAKKTRGEQFLLVNGRYIRSPYLHNAIQNAYQELIQGGYHPSYFINMSIDPQLIDINIHPTKTEIKFADERSIYAIIRSAVKQSLGKYNISPSLDFDQEDTMSINIDPHRPIVSPDIRVNTDFNPFDKENSGKASGNYSKPVLTPLQTSNNGNWQELYSGFEKQEATQQVISSDWSGTETELKIAAQIHNRYIISQIKSGIILIDQQKAHERILFESYLQAIEQNQGNSQQQLFPQTVEFSQGDFQILQSLQGEIKAVGFDISEFGKSCFIVHGIPPESTNESAADLLEGVLEGFKETENDVKIDKRTSVAQSLARKSAIKAGKKLTQEEINGLIDQLFACKMPYSAPNGDATIVTLTLDELSKKFEQKK
ncbi:MAG: DNA mismatch repair endonuclease MutL [Flavobacteriales bacterium]|nr:DNA mismatch repair endonuclease MutL [Flavobacteriales bacterium]